MTATIFLSFNWNDILWGSEDSTFLIEIIIRTLIMFFTIVTGLRVLGKRGVKQLSIFELVVIIGLGSAAGDPMFYKDVGILSSIAVFVVIILFYSLLTYLIGRFKKLEHLLEGKSICLIKEGVFAINEFRKENLGSDEFFSELRLKSVSHLGQIEMAIVETNGGISLFFYEDENVKYGLPVMPNSLDHPLQTIAEENHYSCTFCGFTEKKIPGPAGQCTNCGKKHWVPAINKKRVT